MNLSELFARTRADGRSHAFTAIDVPTRNGVYVAADRSGRPCLFVETSDSGPASVLKTSHVSLRVGGRYDLTFGGAPRRSIACDALCCESTDPTHVETFLLIIEALLAQTSVPLGRDEMGKFFRSLVSLFAVQPAPDLRSERQGLWGELFFMSRFRGFAFWADFWHTEPNRRFDFSAAGHRVEVKSALGALRIHHFAHRQIFAQEGDEIRIASLLLSEDDTGLSLRELIAQCRAALVGSSNSIKLERAVRVAGMDDPDEVGPTFNAIEAERELSWFRAEDAPQFRMPEPPGVSDTRYRVDLSTALPLVPSQISSWLDTWTSAPGAQTI